MKKDRRALLFLAHGGMELSWRYAWASFLMISIVHQPFPLPGAIGTFLLAAALSRVVRGKGLRVISVLGLHLIGFLLAASRIIYSCNYRAYPYFDKGWLLAFLGRTRDSLEWLILLTILIFALLFWLAGVALVRRSTAYLSICIRFDYGVAAFFCLFILKSLLLVKWGIEVRDPALVLLLFSFFIFSLLAIGLARNSDNARRHFLAGYKGVGMLVSFTVVVLAVGAGLVLIPILERVLLFLFGRSGQQEPLFPSIDRGEAKYIPSGESSWWSETVLKILGGGSFGLGLLVGLILCALGTWYLLRWLFARKSKEHRNTINWQLMLLWAQRLLAVLAVWAVQQLKGYRDAAQLYRAFLKWGLRSGIPHLLNETPAEYGSRLRKRFPPLAGEIGWIVDTFNLMVYGEVAIDDAQMNRAQLSLRKLRSPKYWPTRLKSWFLQEPG